MTGESASSDPKCEDCNDCGVVLRVCREDERGSVVLDGDRRREYRPGLAPSMMGLAGSICAIGPRMRIELCRCVRGEIDQAFFG